MSTGKRHVPEAHKKDPVKTNAEVIAAALAQNVPQTSAFVEGAERASKEEVAEFKNGTLVSPPSDTLAGGSASFAELGLEQEIADDMAEEMTGGKGEMPVEKGIQQKEFSSRGITPHTIKSAKNKQRRDQESSQSPKLR